MHLHIGKNNVLGRAFYRCGECKIVTSTELFSMTKEDLLKFPKISISAFNPENKIIIQNHEDDLTKFLINNVNPKTHIVYFSTSRVFDIDKGTPM